MVIIMSMNYSYLLNGDDGHHVRVHVHGRDRDHVRGRGHVRVRDHGHVRVRDHGQMV